MPPKKGAKKKAGYQMPEQFTAGFVLLDIYKKPWCVGKPIGQGGFGLIYAANKGESQNKNSEDADYVVKIEPLANGPLFSEIHFYTACSKEDDLKKFTTSQGLKHLAMPKYVSSGICKYNENDYRFLVMQRYSTDLQRILSKPESHNRVSSEAGCLCLMDQLLWALQYMHERGYAHGDIKGANLMLKNDAEAFLVDFGLAYRFRPRDGVHLKYVVKPERRHNGTIEYTSRDAHDGANISRRSDMEILGFCVIHWMCGKLPWIDLIKNPVHVQESKKKSMDNVKEFLSRTLQAADKTSISDTFVKFIEFYLNEVNKLEFEDEPDYAKIHKKIRETLTSLGNSKSAKDNFYIINPKATTSKAAAKSKFIDELEDLEDEDLCLEVSAKDVAKKRMENGYGSTVTPKSKKRAPAVESLIDSDSNGAQETSTAGSSKKARKLPSMFDNTVEDSFEVAVKKSPLIKLKAKTVKPKSKLVDSSPKPSPARNTPLRTARLESNLTHSYRDEYVSDSSNSDQFCAVKTPMGKTSKDTVPPKEKVKVKVKKLISPRTKKVAVTKNVKLQPKIVVSNELVVDSDESLDDEPPLQNPPVTTEKKSPEESHIESPFKENNVLHSLNNYAAQAQPDLNDDLNKTKSQVMPTLVKKVRNKESQTISTQTDKSYVHSTYLKGSKVF